MFIDNKRNLYSSADDVSLTLWNIQW